MCVSPTERLNERGSCTKISFLVLLVVNYFLDFSSWLTVKILWETKRQVKKMGLLLPPVVLTLSSDSIDLHFFFIIHLHTRSLLSPFFSFKSQENEVISGKTCHSSSKISSLSLFFLFLNLLVYFMKFCLLTQQLKWSFPFPSTSLTSVSVVLFIHDEEFLKDVEKRSTHSFLGLLTKFVKKRRGNRWWNRVWWWQFIPFFPLTPSCSSFSLSLSTKSCWWWCFCLILGCLDEL